MNSTNYYNRLRRFIRKIWLSDHSENGESSYISKHLLLHTQTAPYLIDIGAHDGTTWSNSYYFLKKGWKGILVEPLPGPFKRMKQYYSNDSNVLCLQLACSSNTGQAKLFLGSDGDEGMGSTLYDATDEYMKNHRQDKFIHVQTDTLTNILQQNSFPRKFGILFIDCEGMDLEILQSLDIQRFQPSIIVSEIYRPNPEKEKRKIDLLTQWNYKIVQTLGSNGIWSLTTE